MTTGERRIRPVAIVLAYSFLFGVALLWCALDERSLFERRGDFGFVLGIGVAVLGAVAVVGATRLITRTRWATNLSAEFRAVLGPMTTGEIAAVSFASGVAEEAFFRGAMQPSLGLVPTSLIFGLLHIGPTRDFLGWTAAALALGFLLGWHTEVTGSIAGAALAHFTINYFNLGLIMSGASERP